MYLAGKIQGATLAVKPLASKTTEWQTEAMSTDEIDRIVEQWNRARPDLDVSPTHILQRITRLSLLQQSSFAGVFARHGLTWGEYLVLATLRRAGPPYRMNPTDLYGSVILSSGGMTKRLDGLERSGFVERLPDPTDRRGRLVALTTKGREVVDLAVVDHLANEQQLLGALSAGERQELTDLLRKLLLSAPFQALDPASSLEK
jgi:DNA-binding MarR family transcriptional regulator